ncbi:MAG: acetyltransferase, N-acetylglutamate synthase [Solidesulfovibrio magneticus str. Maddingley MBC34]|uniref:Acetyltransferase, N-acetylglutamate synthase n=1 Tax=Solidesulfovibrio magneticus str. Maddingley MBC34 TaxID=1206767 RepID=K6GML2_9BACT|nr:MAG: acetyltransferase, N-acetylglutamate synthase [Solidesulfovibrio magneticus str. Maddingley MBC34]
MCERESPPPKARDEAMGRGEGKNWIVRQADLGEAGDIAALIVLAYGDVARRFDLHAGNCPTHPSLMTRERIERGMALGTTMLLAFDGGTLCGCVGLRQPVEGVSILERLAVDPACRRLGLGRTLVGRACFLAGQVGAGQVEIGIIAKQHELRQWYETLGFRAVRTASFDNLPFEVLYLRKAVGAGALG